MAAKRAVVEIELVPYLVVDGVRNANRTGLGERFAPRGHRYAIAEGIGRHTIRRVVEKLDLAASDADYSWFWRSQATRRARGQPGAMGGRSWAVGSIG